MLVGRNAPLQIDLKTRCTHASDKWDFFKPNMNSEYPVVNGAHSQNCYLKALDDCYKRFAAKTLKGSGAVVNVSTTDYFLFHSPYNKLVQKGLARLVFHDMLSGALDGAAVERWRGADLEATYDDKELEAALKGTAGPLFKAKLALPCEISRQLGNTYTASVYLNLAYLVSSLGSQLVGKNIVLYSYGSGALASMFRITAVAAQSSDDARFSLESMQSALNLDERLAAREKLTVADLNAALKAREDSHCTPPFRPTYGLDTLAEGAYYLEEISSVYERKYNRKLTK